ncbi:MAG: GDP-L-fucose synthase [Candidatus Dadabacteria bacterium]|nr:MAG: GDP-L-fucose synthase [Candidatus Dadabacteria bacterium]
MEKVLITGSSGFLGRHLVRELQKNAPYLSQIHTFRSYEYDLRERDAVRALLADKPCDTIIHLAALVGGIGANKERPGEFFYDNLMMGVNLIEEARKAGVKKFVNIGTICSYPKFTPVPFKEENFWDGYPEETNAPYGIAKKALYVQLLAYRQQYGFNGITLLVVNLYGPEDNFDLETSHVIPAMIRKFHNAKTNGEREVVLWGDGSPSREFLYVEDAARAIRLAAERYESAEPINIGAGREITMKKLAETIKKVVGYTGEIRWDTSKPNGQPRRCLDVTKAEKEIGFKANVLLPMGLEETYKWFVENIERIEEEERREAISRSYAPNPHGL